MSDSPKLPGKDEYAQFQKEHDLELAEQANAERERDLVAAYDDAGENAEGGPRSQAIDKETEDDWQYLKRIAMTKFPEGSQILGLTAKNRLVAVAKCLGWTNDKISKAAKINISTVKRWVSSRPDVKLFMDEFNLRNAAEGKDIVKEKFSTLEYKAVQCIDAILSDKSKSEAAARLKLDASKWVFDRTRGAAKQTVEHAGQAIKQLLTALGSAAKDMNLSEAEEKDLFSAPPADKIN